MSVPIQNNWDCGIGPEDALRFTVTFLFPKQTQRKKKTEYLKEERGTDVFITDDKEGATTRMGSDVPAAIRRIGGESRCWSRTGGYRAP
jgi:hypothetical protein